MQPTCDKVTGDQGPRPGTFAGVRLEPICAISTSGRTVTIRHMRRIWAVIGTFRTNLNSAAYREMMSVLSHEILFAGIKPPGGLPTQTCWMGRYANKNKHNGPSSR